MVETERLCTSSVRIGRKRVLLVMSTHANREEPDVATIIMPIRTLVRVVLITFVVAAIVTTTSGVGRRDAVESPTAPCTESVTATP
jgi:hypothetical protein